MTQLSVHLLGRFRVALDGEPATGFISDKARALLAYLAVEADWPHRREALAGLLWPDYPERAARASLRSALANVRDVIGDRVTKPPLLCVLRQTIQFSPEGDAWVDVTAFSRLLTKQPAPTADGQTIHRLQEAVELYQGDFLTGFSVADSAAFEEWILLTREQLRRQAQTALQQLVDHYEDCDDAQRGLEYAWRQVEMDPLPEAAQRQLMRLLALNGQREAALAHYETYRQLLATEIGVEPSEDTRKTFELLLRGELPSKPPTIVRVLEREPRAVGECPYLGLAVFREADAPFFFGRENFTAQLLEAVRERPLVAVIVGSSGCGKSSAVFAGLLPRLRGTSPRLRDGGEWLVADFRPGNRPFDALAAALLPMYAPELDATSRLIEAGRMARALLEGDLDLDFAAAQTLQKHPGAKRLLLVVDQFEELYALCPEPELRQRFLDELLAAVEAGAVRQDGALVWLLTMRADFMGQALAYRPFADALQEASLMMGPMKRQELRAAIEKPAEKQGAAFEAGLVERLLDDVGQEPGNLPLLEFALTLLWERKAYGWLTHARYEEIGRVEGALARYADEIYAELDATEQDLARRVFVQLVRPGEGTEDTRRTASRAELGDADENWAVVQHLADKRLIVTGRDAAGNETVEVVHEALIQRWRQLRAWMAEDRAFRLWQERLRGALRGWETSAQDEGALLRGVPLAEAEGWLTERGTELSPVERAYIETSVTLRERRQADRERGRRRTILGLAGGLVIALVLALLVGQQWQRAEQEVDARTAAQAQEAEQRATAEAAQAEEAAQRVTAEANAAARATAQAAAEAAEQEALRLASVGLAAQALAELEGPAPERAVLLALEALEGYPYTGQAESALAQAVAEHVPYTLLHSDAAEWYDAAWSPDGEHVAAVGGYYVSGRGTLAFWNVDPPRLTSEMRVFAEPSTGVGCQPLDLAWSPGGDRLVVSTQTRAPGVESCPAPRVLDRLGHTRAELAGHAGNVNGLDWSPDGTAILTASDDGTVKIWDVVEKGASDKIVERLALRGHSGPVLDAVWSPTGERVATASQDGTVGVWDAETGVELFILSGHAGDVTGVAWSPDGGRLASAGTDGTARVWSLPEKTGSAGVKASGEVLLVLAGHGDEVRGLDWAPDGERIATVSEDGTARVWDAGTGSELLKLRGAGGHLEYVAWSPSGDGLLTEGGAEAIRVWDLSEPSLRLPDHGAVVFDAQWSPDGTRLATTCLDGAARIWDAASGEQLLRLDHPAGLWRFDWSPDGKRIVTVLETGVLWVWDVVGGELLLKLSASDNVYSQPAWSPDGSRIVARSWGSFDAVIVDALTGATITTVREARCDDLQTPSWSPDGDRFVSGCTIPGTRHTPALIWDAAEGENLLELPSQDGLSSSTQWSPDGTRIAVCYTDGPCKVWDVAAGQALVTFSAHTVPISDLTWSPDGARIASADGSGTVKVWDAASGVEVLSFTAPANAELVNWSPDGNYVIVTGDFNTPLVRRVWTSTEELIAHAKECCVTRELTDEERVQFELPPR